MLAKLLRRLPFQSILSTFMTNMGAQAAGAVNESLIEDFNFKPGL